MKIKKIMKVKMATGRNDPDLDLGQRIFQFN